MQVYTVGGAVRDKLLGIEPKDVDYVVVGSSHAQMLQAGFKQVGADFPVYLHPETGAEWALARTERKSGTGYNGFIAQTDSVTLTDDLERRDLTINAMAMKDGVLYDPYGGACDLRAGILRHVSPAFSDDPLRVLRVARFAARYNFEVAPETITLMAKNVQSGELANLTRERCWKELDRALAEPHPWKFFDVLEEAGALWNPQVPFFHDLFKDRELLHITLDNFENQYSANSFYAVTSNITKLDQGALKASSLMHRIAHAYEKLIRLLDISSPGNIHDAENIHDVLQKTSNIFGYAIQAVELRAGTPFSDWLNQMMSAYKIPTASTVMQVNPLLEGPALGQALKEARIKSILCFLK